MLKHCTPRDFLIHIFYNQGWRGINIDARPGSMKLFDKLRKRYINLEIAVSDIKEELKSFTFKEPALNGFLKIYLKRVPVKLKFFLPRK